MGSAGLRTIGPISRIDASSITTVAAQQRVRRTSVSRGWRGGSFSSSRYDAQHRGGPSGCAACRKVAKRGRRTGREVMSGGAPYQMSGQRRPTRLRGGNDGRGIDLSRGGRGQLRSAGAERKNNAGSGTQQGANPRRGVWSLSLGFRHSGRPVSFPGTREEIASFSVHAAK